MILALISISVFVIVALRLLASLLDLLLYICFYLVYFLAQNGMTDKLLLQDGHAKAFERKF